MANYLIIDKKTGNLLRSYEDKKLYFFQEDILKYNIEMYKFQNEQDIILKGGKIISDDEYLKAELKCQEYYAIILGSQGE